MRSSCSPARCRSQTKNGIPAVHLAAQRALAIRVAQRPQHMHAAWDSCCHASCRGMQPHIPNSRSCTLLGHQPTTHLLASPNPSCTAANSSGPQPAPHLVLQDAALAHAPLLPLPVVVVKPVQLALAANRCIWAAGMRQATATTCTRREGKRQAEAVGPPHAVAGSSSMQAACSGSMLLRLSSTAAAEVSHPEAFTPSELLLITHASNSACSSPSPMATTNPAQSQGGSLANLRNNVNQSILTRQTTLPRPPRPWPPPPPPAAQPAGTQPCTPPRGRPA